MWGSQSRLLPAFSRRAVRPNAAGLRPFKDFVSSAIPFRFSR
jgi:hypothetical protein